MEKLISVPFILPLPPCERRRGEERWGGILEHLPGYHIWNWHRPPTAPSTPLQANALANKWKAKTTTTKNWAVSSTRPRYSGNIFSFIHQTKFLVFLWWQTLLTLYIEIQGQVKKLWPNSIGNLQALFFSFELRVNISMATPHQYPCQAFVFVLGMTLEIKTWEQIISNFTNFPNK